MLFSYIAGSAFIFQSHFGLSPMGFSLCFGLNAIGLGLGSYMARRFKTPPSAVICGSTGALCAGLLLAPLLWIEAPVWLFEAALWIMLSSCGITFPAAATLVLDIERKNAGTAAALLGAFPFIVGAVASPLISIGSVPFTTSLLIVAIGIPALILSIGAQRKLGVAYLKL